MAEGLDPTFEYRGCVDVLLNANLQSLAFHCGLVSSRIQFEPVSSSEGVTIKVELKEVCCSKAE